MRQAAKGKPRRKAVEAPRELSRAELYDLIWRDSVSAAAVTLGVSRNTLSKICDRLLIPYPMRGHRGHKGDRPPLGPPPEGTPELIILSKTGSTRSRRATSRLSPEERTNQILTVASEVVDRVGLMGVSMKRIAARAGISETLIYRYFPTLQDLLVRLARRELIAVRQTQGIGDEPAYGSLDARIYAATKTYLTAMAERGALLQILLNDPTIAANLRRQSLKDRQTVVRSLAQAAVRADGVPSRVAEAASAMSTAVTMRAGRLVVQKKMPLDLAFQMSHAVARCTARAVARSYGPKK